MPKFPNPSKRCCTLSHQKHDKRPQEPSSKNAHGARLSEQRTHTPTHHPSLHEILDELARIQTNVEFISARIQHLQDLVSRDEAGSTRAAELIQRLKETHAELQVYHEAVERQLGGDAADMVGDVAERVMGAIERLIKAEARILGGNGNGDEEEMGMMSGALPISSSSGDGEDSSSDTMDLLDAFPRAGIAVHDPRSTPSSPIHSSWNPRPRTKVIASLQHEEARTSLHVRYAGTAHRGSADGFTITYMIMSGAIDHRFVLPYFAYMRHREVRGLKNWLADREIVTRRRGASRIEKVLHCVLILQTGMRYESIAVVFSRRPREVVGACGEVMGGLLEMYEGMVRDGEGEGEGDREERVNGKRWGIVKRYEANEGAEEYFGYSWNVVQKVLVALNTFIGRYRGSQSIAPRKDKVWWGRFEGTTSNRAVWEDLESYRGSSDGEGQVEGEGNEKLPGGLHAKYENLEQMQEEGGVEDSESTSRAATRRSSSPYEEPNLQAIPRPLAEGH